MTTNYLVCNIEVTKKTRAEQKESILFFVPSVGNGCKTMKKPGWLPSPPDSYVLRL